MKFLVLALCVAAASAATFPTNGAFKSWQKPVVAKSFAEVKTYVQPEVQQVVQPLVQVSQPVVEAARYVAPVAVAKNVNYAEKDDQATVLRSDTDVLPNGFNFAYETSNGIAASATGNLKKVDNTEALAIEGQFQYVSPEGVPVQFTYVADENGYQPRSDLLPVAPPVPVAIARALEYIAAHPAPKEVEVVRKF